MKIVELKLDELTPFENNAKIHTDKDVDVIANSIKEFGMNDPIGIWGDKNIIVEGHGRLLALKKLGYETVPCIRLDHLTDEQRRMYTLTHNKSAELSEWDFEKLEQEMKQLEFELSNFGFDEKELMVEFNKNKETEEDDFDVEENLPEEPTIRRGQLYKLGNHYLMCGDSTNKNDVEKLMQGNKADLVFTDPPYGISVVQGNDKGGGGKAFGKIGGGKIVESKVYSKIIGDDTTETAEKSFAIYKELSKNQIIFGGNYFTDFLYPSRCWLVWDKENTGNFADVELAWTSFEKSAKLYKWLWNGMSRKGERKYEGKTRVHPTQKPVGLVGEILQDFSAEDNIILDVFGGSGSTLIACEQLNRQCFIMELDEQYCDVIIKRYEQLTGQKAELVD